MRRTLAVTIPALPFPASILTAVTFACPFTLACSAATDASSIPSPPSSPAEGIPEAEPTADEPLLLPEGAPEPPPWLEPAQEPPQEFEDKPFDDRRVRALGQRVALVTARAGAFLVDLDRGVRGPLGLAEVEPAWLGLDGDDRVLAADADGVLYRLDGDEQPMELARIDDATSWDASGNMIAAGTRNGAVKLLDSDGKELARTVVRRGQSVAGIFVHSAGDPATRLVAQLERDGQLETYLWTRRRGRTWRRSEFQPGALTRRGSWVVDPACPAVLAADGKQWLHRQLTDLDRALEAWTDRLSFSRFALLWGRDPAIDADQPSPPATGSAPPLTGQSRCHGATEDGSDHLYGFRLPRQVAPARPFQGLDHRTEGFGPMGYGLYLMTDGTCSPEHLSDHEWSPDRCSGDPPPLRSPQTVFIDESLNATIGSVPPGCETPAQTRNRGGLHLLLCREQGHQFEAYAYRAPQRWLAQGRLEAERPGPVTLAPDGTALLLRYCGRFETCGAVVRRPLPLDAADPWFDATVDGAVAYRPAPGGRALALVPSGERTFDLVLAEPDGEARALVRHVPVPEHMGLADLRIDGRRVELEAIDSAKQEHRLEVTAVGALRPMDAAE